MSTRRLTVARCCFRSRRTSTSNVTGSDSGSSLVRPVREPVRAVRERQHHRDGGARTGRGPGRRRRRAALESLLQELSEHRVGSEYVNESQAGAPHWAEVLDAQRASRLRRRTAQASGGARCAPDEVVEDRDVVVNAARCESHAIRNPRRLSAWRPTCPRPSCRPRRVGTFQWWRYPSDRAPVRRVSSTCTTSAPSSDTTAEYAVGGRFRAQGLRR